jgi:hypothetical protein
VGAVGRAVVIALQLTLYQRRGVGTQVRLAGSHAADRTQQVQCSRPLCDYPMYTRYRTGPVDAASRFECALP